MLANCAARTIPFRGWSSDVVSTSITRPSTIELKWKSWISTHAAGQAAGKLWIEGMGSSGSALGNGDVSLPGLAAAAPATALIARVKAMVNPTILMPALPCPPNLLIGWGP